jgi:hypothetical protein
VDEVVTASVAEVVIAGTIGGVAPDPDDVEPTIGAEARDGGVGVHLTVTGHQRLREQARPSARRFIVNIVEIVAAAAAAIAITEQQAVCLVAQEGRIRHATFAVAHHARDTEERGCVERFFTAKVNQRYAVHVAGDVQMILTVQRHRDVVVRVPDDRRRQACECPLRFVEPPLGDGHLTVRIVVGDKLKWRVRQQTELDRMPGPNRLNFNDVGGAAPRNDQQSQSDSFHLTVFPPSPFSLRH